MKQVYPAILLLLLILFLLLSGCIEPQRSTTGPASEAITTTGSSGTIQSTTVQTTTVTPTGSPTLNESSSFLTVTPFPIGTGTSISNRAKFFNPPENVEFPWVVIYSAPKTFKGETIAYSYSLTSPPLQVEADVIPKVVTRTDTVLSQQLDKSWKDVSVTRIAPNTWLKIAIRDMITGEIIDETGYGNNYEVHSSEDLTKKPVPPKKVILTMRTGGNYQIEISGNNVETKNVTLKVRKIGALP